MMLELCLSLERQRTRGSSHARILTCNDPFNRHRPPTVVSTGLVGWSRTLDRSPVRHVLVEIGMCIDGV